MPNDTVRLGRTRAAFAKGYAQKWSTELFKISSLHPTYPPTYGLIDLSGESIKGKFYAEELQRVTDRGLYKIEKIIKSRRRAGKIEYYVKWLGYPEKFNSWVDNVEQL